MQFPLGPGPARSDELIPSPASRPAGVIVRRSDIVGQITGGVPLGLADAAGTEPAEAVAAVDEVPVVRARLAEGLEVVQRGAGPDGRGAAVVGDGVVVVRGAAAVGPDGAGGHEVRGVGEELGDGGAGRGDGVQRGGGLVAVEEVEDVVGLGFWIG